MQLLSHVTLPRTDPVSLGGVHTAGHQFQVGDPIVELRNHRTGDYVVHAQLVTLIRPFCHRGGIATPHLGKTLVILAAKLVSDNKVLRESVDGQHGRSDRTQPSLLCLSLFARTKTALSQHCQNLQTR